MSGTTIAVYRLPIPTSTRIGEVRVVIDRNGKWYINGTRVATTTAGGSFSTLTLDDGEVYYVKTQDYNELANKRKRRK